MGNVILVSGPVIVKENKVLLVKQGVTNFWKFCGGKVEDVDMNLIATARREAMEEVGIDIKILDENPYLIYIKKETPEGLKDVILAHFLATTESEITPSEDMNACLWHDISNLPKDLGPNIIPALKHFGYYK